MKVITKLSLIMCALCLFSVFPVKNTYAADGWLLFGYSYTFPDSDTVGDLQGPATVTIGGDLWRFIGLEVTLGGRWSTTEYSLYANNIPVGSYTEALWSFDMKPYLMLQPKIGVDMVSLRPYVGVGPSFHFTGINSTLDIIGASDSGSDSTFDVGFSAKAGLRLQALKFLFVGVGAEYLYHKATLSDKNYDFSGFTVGAEVGFIW